MTSQKAKLPFRIEDNILIGEKDPVDADSTNVGESILNAFKTKPDLIGQVDALTGKQSTFQQMRERSVKCALWLKMQKIKPGDVIVTCTSNQLEAYVPFLASLYTGAIINPWNHQCGPSEIEYFLKLTTPKVIFVNGNKAGTILEIAIKLHVSPKIVVYDEVENFESLESILDDAHFDKSEIDGFSCTTKDLRDTAVMLFSSGSTDLPKAVEISSILMTCPSVRQAPIQSPGSVGLWFGSLSWCTCVMLTIRTILSYSTAVKFTGFDSEKVCQVIEKYKVNWMLIETCMCNYLVQSGALSKYNVSSLRQVIFTGSVTVPSTHESIIKLLPDVCIASVYGMTEAAAFVTCQIDTNKIGSCGYVCKNTCVMIADFDTGKPLGSNMRGEIRVKCPSMMNGYYKNPENTKNAFDQDGWFRTGDVGYYDEDGDVFVVDRIKMMFKCKGWQVSPIEIETLLQNHPAVYECAVSSVPHSLDGNYPIAFVKKVPGAEVTGEELEQFVAVNLDEHKKLRGGVVFVKNIPRLSNGKINRKELRNMGKIHATN